MSFEDQLINFNLPPELIASQPSQKRSGSKLLRVKSAHTYEDTLFSEIVEYLEPGDVLVFNNTKVRPSRIFWSYKSKQEELVLLDCLEDHANHSVWHVVLSGKKIPTGYLCELPGNLSFEFISREGTLAKLKFNQNQKRVEQWFEKEAQMPLPPYILKARKNRGENVYSDQDDSRYQTVYAEKGDSVAAPTAGLHFTHELMDELAKKGVEFANVYLRVSWGTFGPLQEENFLENKLHSEHVQIDAETASVLTKAHQEGRRIISVGTTSLRSLEFWTSQGMPKEGISDECDLFFKPPWKPSLVDGLITNFHLPKSSLLLLVQSFAGMSQEEIVHVYEHAIDQSYRFFSYGDAMFIDKGRS